MHKEFLMGNEAIAIGALKVGVKLAAGYPGTPSTEVLETLAKRNPGCVHVEWSVNEKAAMEVAAGAAMAGARSLVTMKQVGLNVASDPLMSLAYIGVEGGMVVLVCDDPGPISSQTEQDTRTFAMYSKLPVFDPSTVEEAYEMVGDAFKLSEKIKSPVILRATTRIDHGYASLEVADAAEYEDHTPKGFEKDSSRWVIFPRLSHKNHGLIEKRNDNLSEELSGYRGNRILPATGICQGGKRGICAGGVSFAYAMDALGKEHPAILKVATPFPFPENLALEFLEDLDEVYCLEELDPVLERELIRIAGKHGLKVSIHGKLSGDAPRAGEYSSDIVKDILGHPSEDTYEPLTGLPVRPPVLCAGCPHRASFYAVKQAMKGEKTVYCGDIGCYTLGNAMPLDMCDTCLCMGAGIGQAQGIWRIEPDTKAFAFVGDSTFFASGITGSLNGYISGSDMTLVVLDNSTTAMTGHQTHPGTGVNISGYAAPKADIETVLKGLGVTQIARANPLEHEEAVRIVKETAAKSGFKAIIFKYPCIVRWKPSGEKSHVDADKCVSCMKCIKELGCPGLILKDGKAFVDESQCTGCTLCEQVCPTGAISGGAARDYKGDGWKVKDAKESAASGVGETGAPGVSGVSGEVDITPGSSGAEDSSQTRNILLSGVGGQGTVLASKLIAQASMMKGVSVHSAETIGMAQRGGSVASYIRVGEGVHTAIFGKGCADTILSFEPGEAASKLPFLKKGGKIITLDRPVYPVSSLIGDGSYDPASLIDRLKELADVTVVDTAKAIDDLGSDKVMNTLLLGAAARAGLLGLTESDILEAVKSRLPEKLWDINKKALEYNV